MAKWYIICIPFNIEVNQSKELGLHSQLNHDVLPLKLSEVVHNTVCKAWALIQISMTLNYI